MSSIMQRAENTKKYTVVPALIDFCGKQTQKHILSIENVMVILTVETGTRWFGGGEKRPLTQLEREKELGRRYKRKSYQS